MILSKWCFPMQVPGFRFEMVLFILLRLIQQGKGGNSFHSDFLSPSPPLSVSVSQLRLGHTGTQGTGEVPSKASPWTELSWSVLLPTGTQNPNQTSPREAQHALKYREAISFGKRQSSFTQLPSSCSSPSRGPSDPRAEPGWGHCQPCGQQPPLAWHPGLWPAC